MDIKQEAVLIGEAIGHLEHAKKFAEAGIDLMKMLHLISALSRIAALAKDTSPETEILCGDNISSRLH